MFSLTKIQTKFVSTILTMNILIVSRHYIIFSKKTINLNLNFIVSFKRC